MRARQVQILSFIIDYYSETYFYPSYREIGQGIGLSSTSTVHKHMQKLINEGMIIIKSDTQKDYRLHTMILNEIHREES